MIRYVLQFGFCSPDNLSPDQTEKWYEEWSAALKPLTFWENGLGDYKVDLTPPRGERLLEFLQRAKKEGGRLNSVFLEEQLIDDDQTPAEWFVVDPQQQSEFFGGIWWDLQEAINGHEKHLVVKADRLKPGTHLGGYSNRVYVSERFKAVVEKRRLTGIEFIWVKDTGKYRAPQWYLPVCHQGLGRGLDHPWIDTTRLSGLGCEVVDPRGRHGQSVLANNTSSAVPPWTRWLRSYCRW
jgi:hypothetical protein